MSKAAPAGCLVAVGGEGWCDGGMGGRKGGFDRDAEAVVGLDARRSAWSGRHLLSHIGNFEVGHGQTEIRPPLVGAAKGPDEVQLIRGAGRKGSALYLGDDRRRDIPSAPPCQLPASPASPKHSSPQTHAAQGNISNGNNTVIQPFTFHVCASSSHSFLSEIAYVYPERITTTHASVKTPRSCSVDNSTAFFDPCGIMESPEDEDGFAAGPPKQRQLPADLPRSLDDRRNVPIMREETEMYDAWQGEHNPLPVST